MKRCLLILLFFALPASAKNTYELYHPIVHEAADLPILVAPVIFAQTNVFCPLAANCTWTGANTFTSPMSVAATLSSCTMNGMFVAGSSCYPTLNSAQAAAAALSPVGSVYIPGNYAGTDALTNNANVAVLDMRNSGTATMGIWSQLQPVQNVCAGGACFKLGSDLDLIANGPADLYLAHNRNTSSATTTTTALNVGANASVLVGSTANFSGGGGIAPGLIVGRGTGNAEQVSPGSYTIIDSTHFSITCTKLHSQSFTTTAAAVSGNVATLTLPNMTAQANVGTTIIVAGFSGADTYFNGTFVTTVITTTTISYALVHANASATSNGTVVPTTDLEELGNTLLYSPSLVFDAFVNKPSQQSTTQMAIYDHALDFVMWIPSNESDPWPYGGLELVAPLTGAINTGFGAPTPGALQIRSSAATNCTNFETFASSSTYNMQICDNTGILIPNVQGMTINGGIFPQVAAGSQLGVASLPFGSIFFGPNASNSMKFSGSGTLSTSNITWSGTNVNPTWTVQSASGTVDLIGATNGTTGNTPTSWSCAETTDAQDCFAYGESAASTGGTLTNGLANQALVNIKTATNSTAAPLEVEQNSITNTVATPIAQFESTWNNASLTGQGIIENVTNTASASSSLLMNLQVGNATKMSVDKTGYLIDSIESMTTGQQTVSGADYTNSTTTPSTVFTWTLPATAAAKNYKYTCEGLWESTAATLTAPVFGLNLSAAPTQLTGNAWVQYSSVAGAVLATTGYLSNTTTGSQTLITAIAAGTTSTNYMWRIWGTIEGAAAAGSTFIINAAALSSVTSTLNIRRGAGCLLTASN